VTFETGTKRQTRDVGGSGTCNLDGVHQVAKLVCTKRGPGFGFMLVLVEAFVRGCVAGNIGHRDIVIVAAG
jgi:hypothetical protein